jgi:hypothetical protein
MVDKLLKFSCRSVAVVEQDKSLATQIGREQTAQVTEFHRARQLKQFDRSAWILLLQGNGRQNCG